MFIVIDGGNTNIHVVSSLAASQVSLDFSVSLSANYRYLSKEEFQSHLELVYQNLLQKIGEQRLPKNTQVLAGYAGASQVADWNDIQSIMSQIFKLREDQIEVTSDVALILYSLNDDELLLIGGTGSICAAKSSNGMIRSGGRGFLFDHYGGFAIGRTLIEKYFLHLDAKHDFSVAFDEIHRIYPHSSAEQLTALIYQDGRVDIPKIAQLVSAVFEASDKKDILCCEILRKIAEEQARLVSYVASVKQSSKSGFTLALWGGIFLADQKNGILKKNILENLEIHYSGVSLKHLGVDTINPLLICLEKFKKNHIG